MMVAIDGRAGTSLLARKMRERQQEGYSLLSIALQAELCEPTVSNCLKDSGPVLSVRNLTKLAPVLKLTDAEVSAISDEFRKRREGQQERNWTTAEEQVIIDHPAWTHAQIAQEIGRTASAVKNHLFRMHRDGRLQPEGDSSGGQIGVPVCEKCGQRHRKGPPKWLPEAIDLYQRCRVSCVPVGKYLCVSPDQINYWLGHEGVIRSQSEAAQLRIKKVTTRAHDPDPSRPPPDPQLCGCGCGEWTDGYQSRRNKQDPWQPQKYIDGHYRWPGKFRGSRVDRTGFRSTTFQQDVVQRLAEWNCGEKRFREETGLWRASVLNRDLVRPEYVAIVASALDMDVGRELERAGWKIRTLLQWKILEYLQVVRHRTVLAARVGISHRLIGMYLCDSEMTPTDDTLAKFAPVLPLSAEDVKIIRKGRRAKATHSPESRRRGIETLRERDPDHWRKSGHKAGKASWANREEAMERARRAGRTKSKPIDRNKLGLLLAQDKTYQEVADVLGVKRSTVRKYAGLHGMRTKRGHKHRNRRKAARLNQAHRRRANQRQEVAQQILDGYTDDQILHLTVRKFCLEVAAAAAAIDPQGRGKAITKSVACEMVRKAKKATLSRLTIPS